MTNANETPQNALTHTETAVSQGGAFEVIKKRLVELGNDLESASKEINAKRLQEFGSTEFKLLARSRIPTENSCIARDIVRVGDVLVLGYNVFVGLKKNVSVSDVFSIFRLTGEVESPEFEQVALRNSFLDDVRFVSDFNELQTYYKNTTLAQLAVREGKLLASFQIGERISDIRVFRWSVSVDGATVEYIDNRGERDIELPPAFDFSWRAITRDQIVDGRHPHINIADTIFIDTLGGDFTVKVENNTTTGKGIYSEPVEDANQSLDDAEFHFALVGHLILLKIKPYKEEATRYLVFSKLNETVVRIDAIGQSCVQLPDSHGIVFPGGYYLQTGEYKLFEEKHIKLRFQRMIRSPNGEDVLFVFYEPIDGVEALYPYNLIEKQLRNPLYAHGYGHYDDGRIAVFYVENEPARIHPVQIWQTPFVSDVHAGHKSASQSFYGKIGNAELVKGVSDLFSVVHLIRKPDARTAHFNEICRFIARLFDQYYWLTATEHKIVEGLLKKISETALLVLDEFEKVESIRRNSEKSLAEAVEKVEKLRSHLQPDSWSSPHSFVQTLSDIRKQRGNLLTIREFRYIDTDKIAALDKLLEEDQVSIAQKTVQFLAKPEALSPLYKELDALEKAVETCIKNVELTKEAEKLDALGQGMDLLSETVSGITHTDATVRTAIIENISSLYALLNQAKARTQQKLKNLGSAEALAQFGAQFKLLSQSVTNGLSMSTTPEKCDEQLSRVMNQLQELESSFGQYDQFLPDIISKREEVFETFESHKQQLLDERQRKAQVIHDAATRIIDGVKRRVQKFATEEELNSFFAADPLVEKLRQMSAQLRLGSDSVKADDIDAQVKSAKDQSIRALRDKADIFEEGGKVIKLGRHRFSVNTQELDLAVIPREGNLYFHLTGTEYFEPVENDVVAASKQVWDMSLLSESTAVSRAEYLAYSLLKAAEAQEEGLTMAGLSDIAHAVGNSSEVLKTFLDARYKAGYERGIHDHDALKILQALLPIYNAAGLLRYSPLVRACALLFIASRSSNDADITALKLAASAAVNLYQTFGSNEALQTQMAYEHEKLCAFVAASRLPFSDEQVSLAAEYLVYEMANPSLAPVITSVANQLEEQFMAEVKVANASTAFESIFASRNSLEDTYLTTLQWLRGFIKQRKATQYTHYLEETAALIVYKKRAAASKLSEKGVKLELVIEGLLSNHVTIENSRLMLMLDDFLSRLQYHHYVVVPLFKAFGEQKARLIDEEKARLRLNQFKPKPLTSFVRNKLINESYLPIVGNNLAKQMGTVGENKRSDLMGLLMLISPPGYGKTTLMEYVANRLGLIFMKINCPSMGHEVVSLDPAEAPNATARQEVEKINLALEMGNNVMLYLDDIQHTNPEFLQKFISLCDATRRIDGVWKGRTKTYDMRGKKFCVAMAGNPYTESGEVFKIPDMLANRADIYNLGDVLSGTAEVFSLSYIENAMTSNTVLAPLATRPMEDFYLLAEASQGKPLDEAGLKHPYSAAETKEIIETLKKLFEIQSVVLKVNLQYIASAAQDDTFRSEPPFKLQGSYRNMNKMAERVSSVMTQAEMQKLIDDHYKGEAQLLTVGTEANLLKLKELRGVLTDAEVVRWQEIKDEYKRQKRLGGDKADVGTRVVAQLDSISSAVQAAANVVKKNAEIQVSEPDRNVDLERIIKALENLSQTFVKGEPESLSSSYPMLKLIADTLENSIHPLLKLMDGKLNLDLKTHQKMGELIEQIRVLEQNMFSVKTVETQ